jgi:hypothetical protein
VSQALFGVWDVGGIVNARSGVPINVLVTRPDVVRVWIHSSRTDFFFSKEFTAGTVSLLT